MNSDTVILAAFGLFVLLVVFRSRPNRTVPDGGKPGKVSRFRSVWAIVRLVVLGGLMVYMVPVLWRDFRTFEDNARMEVFLRCLIFVFTIYIFASGVRTLFQRGNKGDNVERGD